MTTKESKKMKEEQKENVSLAVLEEQFLADVEQQLEKENAGGGTRIGTANGIMKINGDPIPGNRMLAVIVYDQFFNGYWDTKFDHEKYSPPRCWAYADSEPELVPHHDVENPICADCVTCPNNRWGSADVGKGKACRNQRKLGLIIIGRWDEDAKQYEVRESASVYRGHVYELNIPPASITAYSKYKQEAITSTKKPSYLHVTEIKCVPAQRAFKFEFTFNDIVGIDPETGEYLPDAQEIFTTITNRQFEVQTQLRKTYKEESEQTVVDDEEEVQY